MTLRIKSTCILFSLSLTFAAYADSNSKWMWHGDSSWVYSHAENGWWYLPLVQSGETEPLSGWAWHGALPWVYSHADGIWRYVTPVSGSGFVVWKQGDGKWYAFDEKSGNWSSVAPGSPVVVTAPVVTLNDAVEVGTNSAILSGSVVSSGGEAPAILFVWGETDEGSQDHEDWDDFTSLGIKDAGALEKTVLGLARNTLYYFRFKATNSAGVTWSEVNTFLTLAN